jgi:hypothetical protein
MTDEIDTELRGELLARFWYNACTWAARIEVDPDVQAYRRARLEAERVGHRGLIDRFLQQLSMRRCHSC